MNKRPSSPTPARPRSGPSWPSYRAIIEARDAARQAEAPSLPWMLWLMLVQPRLAFARLKESGTTPIVGATVLVLLAALVQAATIYSRNALIVATLNNLAKQNVNLGFPAVQNLLNQLLTIGRLTPTTLVLLITGFGLLLWLLLSLLTFGYTRLVGVANPPAFRSIAIILAFCAMPMLAEAVLLPFLLLLEGGALYAIETVYKLLLIPWTIALVYLGLRSLGFRRGQSSSVMLLTFFTLQFVTTMLLANTLWQLVTALFSSASLKP